MFIDYNFITKNIKIIFLKLKESFHFFKGNNINFKILTFVVVSLNIR